jgi:hypothetical protein
MADKEIPLDCTTLVVGQIPISISARINDRAAESFDLSTFRRIDHPLKRLYITSTATSSRDLILFASKGVSVGAIGFGARVELVDSLGIRYDSRDVVNESVISTNTNINDGATETTGEIVTGGFNKLTGWCYASHELTAYVYAYYASGGTGREVDSIAIAATTGTGFSVEVVAPIMEIIFDNSSGSNTTTCEKQVYLSTGG